MLEFVHCLGSDLNRLFMQGLFQRFFPLAVLENALVSPCFPHFDLHGVSNDNVSFRYSSYKFP